MTASMARPPDTWEQGESYEEYIGRWSRPVARKFLAWLAQPAGREWLDVGCGTGALTATILTECRPRAVTGVDPSADFIGFARDRVQDSRVRFEVGDAQALPLKAASVDAAVSGLVLNFVPDPAKAAAEMRRVVRPGGAAAAYVWDYAEGMELVRLFWDEAVALNPSAAAEAGRFPLCRPEALRTLFGAAGFRVVETTAVDVPAVFRDFDDYWRPFLGGQGPAPSYVMSLPAAERDALRERLRRRLPIRPDGSIHLTLRAWAVRGLTQ